MRTLLATYRNDLLDAVLEFLWAQWSALGVPGRARPGDGRIIDPEALILSTCFFGRRDARLFDEMLGWMRSHERFVHVQRIRNMAKAEGSAGWSVLQAAGAWLQSSRSALKWRRLSGRHAEPAAPESLFLTPDGMTVPVVRESEPVFRAHGYAREAVTLRDHLRGFDPELPSNLLIRLRALFGVNSRAEIMTYLLTHERAGAAEIARATYYYRRTVYNALTEMQLSGMLQLWEWGTENLYSTRGAPWQDFTGSTWMTWAPLLRALEHISQFLDEVLRAPTSEALLATDLHALVRRIAPLLQQAEVYGDFHMPAPRADRTYLAAGVDALRRLLDHIRT